MLTDPHSDQKIVFKGNTSNAKSAMVLLHGRGADAESILTLTDEFNNSAYLYAAPQAYGNTWYPYSFLSPRENNEPYLSSALNAVRKLITKLNEKGIPDEEIILLGFSQGACLALEYSAGNAKRYKCIIGLSGGLIGEKIDKTKYKGNFEKSPLFLGCSNKDPHIPEERVHETSEVMEELNAFVIKKIYKEMGHTINEDEINFIRSVL